jgi:hypothetical protein
MFAPLLLALLLGAVVAGVFPYEVAIVLIIVLSLAFVGVGFPALVRVYRQRRKAD